MKNVLVLNQFALPRTEGGGTRHYDLFSRLGSWSPRIVAGNRNHYTQQVYSTDEPLFHLVDLPAGSSGGGVSRVRGWLRYCAGAVRAGLGAKKLDLVYASTPHLLSPVAGWVVSRARRVPLVVEVRDLWPETFVAAGALREGSLPHKALSALERWIMRRAERIVLVTEGWEQHFADMGIPASRLVVVPNGTEVDDFRVETPKDELRAQWGLTRTTVVFSGAHGTQNAIPSIVEAATELPELDFLFVGDGPAKAAAIRQVDDLGLTNVTFRAPVPKSELPSLLAACDIGLHTLTPLALFEQGISPNKVFDYMAAGLPLVSNSGTALHRIMSTDECGRLGDAEHLVECLRAVAEADEAARRAWGERARQIVQEKHSRSAAAARLETLLDDAARDAR